MVESGHRPVAALLADLRRIGVALWTEQGRLLSRTGATPIPDALRAEIRARKAEIIVFLQTLAESAPTPRTDPMAAIPLSPIQERIWFLSQVEGATQAYILPAAVVLDGPLDTQRLSAALDTVVARHEALRTIFPVRDGGPMQQVLPPASVTMPVVDACSDTDATFEARLDAATLHSVDMTTEPPFRAVLYRRSGTQHVLMIAAHHILFDGWSVDRLFDDLSQAYEAGNLADLSLHYADYALWRASRLANDLAAPALTYWRDQLEGAPTLLELPTDLPRPATARFKGGVARFEIDGPLAERLGTVARKQGATLFSLLMSAFAVQLARYSGQRDLLIGMPVADRDHPALEPLIGMFVDTVPVRAQLHEAGEDRFTDLLRQVTGRVFGAFANKEAPFDQIAQQAGAVREAGHPPLVQAMFAMERAPDTLRLGGAVMTPLIVHAPGAKFDLSLMITETDAGLSAAFEYDADLFEPESVARMAGHYQMLLAGIAEAPETPVDMLPMLTDSETRALMAFARPAPPVLPQDTPWTLHGAVENWAARMPDTPALIAEDATLTFAELNARADDLALRLRAAGAGRDRLVALSMERTSHAIVAMLAILKAGAAYLPLDPAWPAERCASVLADAQPVMMLAMQADLSRFEGMAPALVAVDHATPPSAGVVAPGPVDPSDLAYVLFTSGSTGKPKGVMIEHRNMLGMIRGVAARVPAPQPGSATTAVAPFIFDASSWEVWSALAQGSTLHLLDRDMAADGARFAGYLLDRAIAQVFIPPTILTDVIAALEAAERPAPLHYVLTGVEPITQGTFQRLQAVAPVAWLTNGYGPSETTVCCTALTFDDAPEPERRASVGTAWPGYDVHLVDKAMNLVPLGVAGEIVVGGVGVGRGYLHRPDMTEAAFVPNPFDPTPGARLYRTGDLARRLPDGNLEYIGRRDRQVKLRGIRIEPGEIEALLLTRADLREAVVAVRKDEGRPPYLAAYVVPEGPETAPDIATLRADMKARAPAALVPTAFVILDALPVTPNGKIDRAALPMPEVEGGGHGDYVAPDGPVEAIIVTVFADALGLSQVGATDDFFELGGHSLLVARVMARLRGLLGVDLSMRILFEGSTPRTLAQIIAQTRNQALPVLPPLTAAGDSLAAPVTSAQERMLFLERFEGPSPLYHIPLAYRLEQPLDPEILQAAIDHVVARHSLLRASFPTGSDGTCERFIIAPDRRITLDSADHSDRYWSDPQDRAAIKAALAKEGDRLFDIENGPLLRVCLYRLGGGEQIVLTTFHHLIADGASTDIWWRDLSAAYTALMAGRAPKAVPLAVQYTDYARWSQEVWDDPARQAHTLDYWRDTLADAPALLELPTDAPRPARQTFRGQTAFFELPPAQIDALSKLARAQGASLFMVLLAGMALVLSRHSRQDDLVIGAPVSGRQHPETAPMIGLFLNTLPLRLRPGKAETVADLIAQARQTVLCAHEYQDAPFERIVEALDIPRSLSYTPVFQAMLTYHDAESGADDLATEAVSLDNVTAKFDITLSFERRGGRLHGALEYNADLFSASRMAALLGHLQTVLQAMAEHSAAPLTQINMLTTDEREALHRWSTAPRAPLPFTCPHQRIEAQTVATPDAIAVVHDTGADTRTLTYDALNRRANQLAHRLKAEGVGRGDLVGLCLAPSVDLMVSLLAVLKTGAAYAPLDPGLPSARLAQMCTRLRCALALPQDRARLPENLTVWAPQAQGMPENNLDTPVAEDDLIYVIHTSGSTGTPKAAGVYRRGFANLVHWFAERFGFGAQDSTLIVSSVGFDLTQKNFFTPLMVGGSVHFSAAAPYDHTKMRRHIAAYEVSWLNCAPSAFYPFIESDDDDTSVDIIELASLRYIFLGGEPIAMARLAPWLDSAACRARIVNTYGPTECSDVVAYHIADRDQRNGGVPLGGPIDGVTLHVLDTQGALAPIGVAGELHIGGVCLGAGYLGDPDRTAASFVTRTIEGPEVALYRTGDIVRRRADGALDFLGRVDHQVKIRGFRLELGEIESALRSHEAIRDAVVMAAEAGDRLVAWVTAAGERPTPDILRTHLAARLPDYALPAAMMVLDAFPLTASGKIDRKRLPAHTISIDGAHQPPSSPHEIRLAALWRDLLDGAEPGRDDDFFALGGHSLMAVRLVNRIRQHFTVDLPIQSVFEAPTLAAQARNIATAAQAAAPIPTLRRAHAPWTDTPVSAMQKRLWILEQLENTRAAYTVATAYRLYGRVDPETLDEALVLLTKRHESLRTVFPSIGGAPVQRVYSGAKPALTCIDARGWDDTTLTTALKAGADASFDLGNGPLLRVFLYDQGEAAVLSVVMHHIITDDWSMDIFWRELDDAWSAVQAGSTPDWPPLPVQSADLAAWRAGEAQQAEETRHVAYWRKALTGAPASLELPVDHPRPITQTHRGALETFSLDPALMERVQRLGAGAGATPFMLMQAAYALLLARWTEQWDISIGVPVANRDRAETERVIGFLVNTIVLRLALDREQGFLDLLAQARQKSLEAYAHTEAPFESVVSALDVPRMLNQSPLFQTLLVWREETQAVLRLGDGTLTRIEIPHDTAKVDLSLFLSHDPETGSVDGQFEYNTDLFEPITIQRLIARFTRLLEAICDAPTQALARLSILPEAERAALIVPASVPQSAQTLHALFEAQAARTPDAVAVVSACGTETLSYAVLDARANRLAWALRAKGVTRGAAIGVRLGRTPALITAILAILKAGGAYLPLDASYPQDRIAYMLETARTPLILTEEALRETLPDTGIRVATLEALSLQMAKHPAQAPDPVATGDDPLYVLFTSGSTGRPKGVTMPHRGLVNLVSGELAALDPMAARTVQFTPISFDVSCQEIFTTLCGGGMLVMVSEAMRRDPEAFLEHLVQHRIERVFMPFVALQQIAEMAAKRSDLAPPLLDVFSAGEQLRITPAIADWFQRTGARLHNQYGPTETHVITKMTLPAEIAQWPALPGIGRPVTNAAVYILDGSGEPVPFGTPGELYLGGAGVATGYINNPDLTAERFMPNPFGEGMLYRSGDLGRWCADGTIDYLGRTDDQVKIRGHRVDPAEIEQVLAEAPDILDAVVIVREDDGGHRQLVAYIRAATDDADIWRRHLAARLPDYMVPGRFIVVEAMPLTNSGKIDRRALAQRPLAPSSSGPAQQPATPPGSTLEHQIAALWCEILGLEAVGRSDNFFDVGGDSLLIIRLQDRMRAVLSARITVTDLFQHPTVAAQATRLSAPDTTAESADTPNRGSARRRALDQGHRRRPAQRQTAS